jgi:hypothetical protein
MGIFYRLTTFWHEWKSFNIRNSCSENAQYIIYSYIKKDEKNWGSYNLEKKYQHTLIVCQNRAGQDQIRCCHTSWTHIICEGRLKSDSSYYPEWELYGGAVTVTFSKHLPWQAMHLLQRSTHFSKCAADGWSLRNFLPWSSLFMIGKAQKSHEARSELNSLFGFEKVDRWNPIRTSAIQSRSRLMRFLGFSNHERALQGNKFLSDQRPAARFREVDGTL